MIRRLGVLTLALACGCKADPADSPLKAWDRLRAAVAMLLWARARVVLRRFAGTFCVPATGLAISLLGSISGTLHAQLNEAVRSALHEEPAA